jgi:hypothetical protein
MALTVNIDLGYELVVAPVVEAEFEKRVDKYIANLIKQFGGKT